MSLAKTTSIFNNFRIGMAALPCHVKSLPPITTTNYKEALIIGIRASSTSFSDHPHPKEDEDPKLVDNMRQGVFRFQTSEEEEEENRRNQVQAAKDEREMSSNSMGDMARQGTVKAGVNMGDKAKETADNIWNAARETTHKIKEAVAGDDEKDKRGYSCNSDTGVGDLRNKAGGYDRPSPPSMASPKIGNSVKQ